MIESTLLISTITLNVNGLNNTSKRPILADWILRSTGKHRFLKSSLPILPIIYYYK